MNVRFRLAAMKRFGIKLEKSDLNDDFTRVDAARKIERVESSIVTLSNAINLKNQVHYVDMVSSFSLFLKQGKEHV
jgi:hypothetical protein